jgi:hypothetical protein
VGEVVQSCGGREKRKKGKFESVDVVDSRFDALKTAHYD